MICSKWSKIWLNFQSKEKYPDGPTTKVKTFGGSSLISHAHDRIAEAKTSIYPYFGLGLWNHTRFNFKNYTYFCKKLFYKWEFY